MDNFDKGILITGAGGFIGKNLTEHLKCKGYTRLMLHDIDTSISALQEDIKECSYIFHLAGVNRTQTNDEFVTGNHGVTIELIDIIKNTGRSIPILFSSSIQAELENDYGQSKLAAENELLKYGEQSGASALIFRLPNVYGKWCRPNYNSVVATFCHNITRNLPITINDSSAIVKLIFIDDVCERFVKAMETNEPTGRYTLPSSDITLERLASLINSFRDYPNRPPIIADMGEQLVRNLHSTYISYKPSDSFENALLTHTDERGSFTELLHFKSGGQVSVNVSKPNVMKGNHWHHSKVEKFIAIAGTGEVQLRNIHSKDILIYPIGGNKPSVIDIPGGYVHKIVNTGDTDLITIIWANDIYDNDNPDTFRTEIF